MCSIIISLELIVFTLHQGIPSKSTAATNKRHNFMNKMNNLEPGGGEKFILLGALYTYLNCI